MKFNAVYYEPDSLAHPLEEQLQETLKDLPWIPIDDHNSIRETQEKPNSEFDKMEHNLVVGVWKTHKYMENQKVSDYLVPYTSSGYTTMCLCCYLVCNYNECAYLRLFINREQMPDRIIKRGQKSEIPLIFEIGSNSGLALEDTITSNLLYTTPRFIRKGAGNITFPTRFHMVDPLLGLPHQGRTILRMSVNPQPIINKMGLGTSSLSEWIEAMDKMCKVGYPCSLPIASVILTESWKVLYTGPLGELRGGLTEKARNQVLLEVIPMIYSYIHRTINSEAFSDAPEFYDTEQMMGRGYGRYCYRSEVRAKAGTYFRDEIKRILGDIHILYIN